MEWSTIGTPAVDDGNRIGSTQPDLSTRAQTATARDLGRGFLIAHSLSVTASGRVLVAASTDQSCGSG
jgi:hypothetical protein